MGSVDCKLFVVQVHGPQQEMERLRDELVRAHSINGRLHLQVRVIRIRHRRRLRALLRESTSINRMVALTKSCFAVQVQTLSREVLRLQRAASNA
jgi:hypothetical protein